MQCVDCSLRKQGLCVLGLGVDIVEAAIANYPSTGNVSPPNPNEEYVYFRARNKRASWLKP